MPRRARDEDGFTVVELLVAMMLMGVIMAIAGSAVVTSLQTQRRQLAQLTTLNDAKLGLERMSRDVRGANPLGPTLSTTQVDLRLVVGAQARALTYRLVGDELRVDERVTDVTSGALISDPPERRLIDGVVPASGTGIFRFFDIGGNELTGSVTAAAVHSVELRLRVQRPEAGPVDLNERVLLRNAEG